MALKRGNFLITRAQKKETYVLTFTSHGINLFSRLVALADRKASDFETLEGDLRSSQELHKNMIMLTNQNRSTR